ncbi:hypothetical protein [Pseudohongiella acticola]|jgi:hypothetical protein|uniref:hypothetical protein n=1 Tax=Pseudohongiella acticola TaxID=1524254 RepID=UPI0030EDA58E
MAASIVQLRHWRKQSMTGQDGWRHWEGRGRQKKASDGKKRQGRQQLALSGTPDGVACFLLVLIGACDCS